LVSEFILNHEFPRLLAASKRRGLTIVPVAVGPCSFRQVPELASLQFANDPARPLARIKRKADYEAALVDIAEKIGNHMDRTHLLNPLRAMDAVAFRETGLGGSAAAGTGNAALSARALQSGADVVIATAGGNRTLIRWEEIGQLDPQSRKLIGAFDSAISDLYERWTETYPKALRQAANSESAQRDLEGIRCELCAQFNALLDFFQHRGWSLEDHYHGVRYLCRKGA
jgi:hypothetical protein